jgi:acyl-CoA thioesterase FadM
MDFEERAIATRWLDFDVNGHITDTAYSVFFAEARADYIAERLGGSATLPTVTQQIDFRAEVPFPARSVLVRTRVAKLGRTSATFEQELVRGDGEIAASGTAVLVAWDPDQRSSRELSEEERKRLTAASPAAA